MMTLTSFQEFANLARPGSRVPIVGELVNDLDTPLALYGAFAKDPFSFLLESVEGGEKWGRYSFIGLRPSLVFRSWGKRVEVLEKKKKTKHQVDDPLSELKALLHRYEAVSLPGLPRFHGGAVGWVSYDMVRFFERIPDRGKKVGTVPDLFFIIPEVLLVADNFEQTLKIIFDARIDEGTSLKKEYDRGVELIQRVARSLSEKKNRKNAKSPIPKWRQNLTREGHKEIVEKAKEYIRAGDITQTVLSVCFEGNSKLDPFALYRALRRVNPSPYMFLVKCEETSLVGASPETMVRLEEGEMTLRPIAGTRWRGKTEEEDRRLEKDLLADEKERAEHIMLVDLGRNDLGRVAAGGTVHVDELMTVERYSHVMHIVSNVRAKLASGNDAFDLLRATFPAGTLSGSPKIRAMEIIEESEPTRRGCYGGCVGYFDFSGNMDMAITIRSALLHKGKITIQAGGGIVADSNPDYEYQEVQNKAKGMMKAVEVACS